MVVLVLVWEGFLPLRDLSHQFSSLMMWSSSSSSSPLSVTLFATPLTRPIPDNDRRHFLPLFLFCSFSLSRCVCDTIGCLGANSIIHRRIGIYIKRATANSVTWLPASRPVPTPSVWLIDGTRPHSAVQHRSSSSLQILTYFNFLTRLWQMTDDRVQVAAARRRHCLSNDWLTDIQKWNKIIKKRPKIVSIQLSFYLSVHTDWHNSLVERRRWPKGWGAKKRRQSTLKKKRMKTTHNTKRTIK